MSVVRRTIAIAIVTAFLAIPICSFFVRWRIADGAHTVVAYSLFMTGALISVTNFYVSFVRPILHAVRRASARDLRHISPGPFLGMLTVPGLALAPSSLGLSIACLVLVAADTGNIVWFVICVWRDTTFWSPAD